ncbi:MAG: hypothetical protein IH971_02550 [Candidatus Marinimicrobia bacterium]|nr:hypothetical protein [Candidatus Neomarinimicrobiota bacterium]
MGNEIKIRFIHELANRFGPLKRLPDSRSLIDIGDELARVYVRYSALHKINKTFYGLREKDLLLLEGRPSYICFLWEGQFEPLLVPYSAFEEVFQIATAASDGQYKVQVFPNRDATELYIAKQGRFNVEAYFGWGALETLASSSANELVPELSHSQIQTLLGAIGAAKKFDIWIPPSDRSGLDYSLTDRFDCRKSLPTGFDPVSNTLKEIDVLWIQRGSNELRALFEVEHSTPIYSGLLRFNDIHLATPQQHPRYSIVANDTRRALFVRQVNRPTFRTSGLNEVCTFLEYADVYGWNNRLNRL